MGKTNRLLGLESKMAHLLGELEAKRAEVVRIEALVETLPAITARIQKIEEVILAAEIVIKDDHPEWERDTINPIKPNVHQIPVRLGEATRKALEVLRDASEPLRMRDIAREVLRREGLTDYNSATLDKVTNSIGNTLKKRSGVLMDCPR